MLIILVGLIDQSRHEFQVLDILNLEILEFFIHYFECRSLGQYFGNRYSYAHGIYRIAYQDISAASYSLIH